MGVLWTVWPLDPQMIEWLKEQDIAFPSSASRWPTGSEIKQALSDSGLEIDIIDNGFMKPWYAFVEDPSLPDTDWAHLVVEEYSGDSEPQKPYFSKGSEALIKRILSRVALASGPLVLLNDVGSPPEVVAASA